MNCVAKTTDTKCVTTNPTIYLVPLFEGKATSFRLFMSCVTEMSVIVFTNTGYDPVIFFHVCHEQKFH